MEKLESVVSTIIELFIRYCPSVKKIAGDLITEEFKVIELENKDDTQKLVKYLSKKGWKGDFTSVVNWKEIKIVWRVYFKRKVGVTNVLCNYLNYIKK
ncbi:MAG: hypothetical protein ACKKMV_01940 [Candidatus Nealsonbacteria bacterium]|nr:MAG: hypothetical protein IB617_03620 [Candidatus Nealsonbacteria bacterium]